MRPCCFKVRGTWVLIQLGPINADCKCSKNPPHDKDTSIHFPSISASKRPRQHRGLVFAPSQLALMSLGSTLEGFASLDTDPNVLTGILAFTKPPPEWGSKQSTVYPRSVLNATLSPRHNCQSNPGLENGTQLTFLKTRHNPGQASC